MKTAYPKMFRGKIEQYREANEKDNEIEIEQLQQAVIYSDYLLFEE